MNWVKALKLAARSSITLQLPGIDDLSGLVNEGDIGDDPEPRNLDEFRRDFAELLADEHLSHVRRVVVLVDDLDRCLPDAVVDTLETMRLFLSVPKMSFIIAADENRVADALRDRYPEDTGSVNSRWWNPRERRGRRGARLTRRVREEYRVYFDRNATMSGAKRRGSAGMDRRSNAVWVLPQAVKDTEEPARLYLHKIVQTTLRLPALSRFDTEAYLLLLLLQRGTGDQLTKTQFEQSISAEDTLGEPVARDFRLASRSTSELGRSRRRRDNE